MLLIFKGTMHGCIKKLAAKVGEESVKTSNPVTVVQQVFVFYLYLLMFKSETVCICNISSRPSAIFYSVFD